ncbi:7328_t:CDS:1, partial [Cetraspora pellucida]
MVCGMLQSDKRLRRRYNSVGHEIISNHKKIILVAYSRVMERNRSLKLSTRMTACNVLSDSKFLSEVLGGGIS